MHPEDEVQFNRRALTDDFLAEIDALSAPAERDAVSATSTPANPINPALMLQISAKAAELKADAYANGWTVQEWREIDAHRKANPEDHARNRRGEYQQKVFTATGKLPRRNRKNPTPEQRADDVAAAQQRRRNDMTPDDKKAESAKRKARRAKAKEAAQSALQELPTFGKF